MDIDEFKESIQFILEREKLRIKEDGPFVADRIYNLFKEGYSTNWTWLGPEEFRVFRGRINKERKPFDNISDLSYAPAQVTKAGRANFANNQVFYAASREAVCMAELRPQKSDFITTVEAKSSKEKQILKPIFQKEYFRSINLSDKHILFEQFLSDIFIKPAKTERDYLLPSAFAGLFFIHKVDGIMYASVAANLKGVNLALSSAYVDEYITPFQFRCYEVIEVNGPADFVIRCTHYSNIHYETGKIDWGLVTDCPGHHISEEIWNHIKNPWD